MAEDGGHKTLRKMIVACTTIEQFCAFGGGVGNELLTLDEGIFIDESAEECAFIAPIAYVERHHVSAELFGKFLDEAYVNIKTVSTHAGLSTVAEFAVNRALYCGI